MSDFSNDTKFGMWKNDKRTGPTHPILKAGKPVAIGGAEYWVSAWINAPKDAPPALVQKIEAMIDYLAEQNQNYPIVSVSLSPAEAMSGGINTSPASPPAEFNDEIPF